MPGWESIPRLIHGFYGRRGGVSDGAFAELNLSARVGDAPEAVGENWSRVTADIPAGTSFATMRQVHGAHVVTVERCTPDMGEADALVTRTTGVALSVLTADCVPILLVAPHARVVAAVHAGWRGTVAGIAERAVRHLCTVFHIDAAAISAALGPAIAGCCYEIEASVVDELERRYGALPSAVRRPRGRRPHLDLRSANTAVLVRAGLREGNITRVGPCTRCAVTEYFSYRAVKGATGRQLSFIGWRG